MKFILSLLLLLSIIVNGQSTMSADIDENIKEIFKVSSREYGDKKFVVSMIDTLTPTHYLYDFVKSNRLMLDYLSKHQLDINKDSLNKLSNDSKLLSSFYSKSIFADSSFLKTIKSMINLYITSKDNYEVDIKKDTVSIDEVMSLAVRFFYPNKLVGNGSGVSMKFCIGTLSFADYEMERNYVLEAFLFQTLFSNYKKLEKEYSKAVKHSINLNLSSIDEVKLHRIQGATWALLSKNDILKELVLEYSKNQSLPFVISL
jgi:hypothetical protein